MLVGFGVRLQRAIFQLDERPFLTFCCLDLVGILNLQSTLFCGIGFGCDYLFFVVTEMWCNHLCGGFVVLGLVDWVGGCILALVVISCFCSG